MLSSALAVSCSLHLVIVHSLAAQMNNRQKRAWRSNESLQYRERNRLMITTIIASALVIGVGLWEFYDHLDYSNAERCDFSLLNMYDVA